MIYNYSVDQVGKCQLDVLAICRNDFVLEYDNYINYRVGEYAHGMI